MFCFGFFIFILFYLFIYLFIYFKKSYIVGWSHGGIVGSRLVLVLVLVWIKLSPTHFAKKKGFNATQKKKKKKNLRLSLESIL